MLTFLDRLLPLMGKLAKRVDLAAPVFVIVVLVVMILPMPAWALDILITFNITISLLILMVGMYVPRPQEFNAYPSILLMVTIYLRDIEDAVAMNAIWDAWLPCGSAPARVCIEANLRHHDFLLEVAVIAAR